MIRKRLLDGLAVGLSYLVLVTLPPMSAQSTKTFDAVSIKPSVSENDNSDTKTSPGRLSLLNVTPISLIQRGFGMQKSQIVNAPDWLTTARFDITAVTGDAARLTDTERQPFLQSMLADRFQLKFHRETRELPVLSFVAAKEGSKLTPHTGEGVYSMKVETPPGKVIIRSTKGTISRLVEILSRMTERIVSDNTGLAGDYDFTLEWATDSDVETSGSSLFTALQEQLGLRLDATKRPVEVVVIDRVERPSEN